MTMKIGTVCMEEHFMVEQATESVKSLLVLCPIRWTMIILEYLECLSETYSASFSLGASSAVLRLEN